MQLFAHVVRRLDRVVEELERQRRADTGEQAEAKADQQVEHHVRLERPARDVGMVDDRHRVGAEAAGDARYPCSAAAGRHIGRGLVSTSRCRMLYWMLRARRFSTCDLSEFTWP